MTVDFNDYFWGEKNNGFDVLYHNMKYGLVASKELSDFFREKSNIEEQNSKLMTKLANKAGSGCLNGTFAPIWVVLKSSADRLASLHLQMVQKISELVKDVSKYADELSKKHKQVKEEEASTLDVVQQMQSSTVSVQKSKDLYTNRLLELEKLRKDGNGSQKDVEKIETKLKKQQDDYKILLEKHNPIKMEFEKRMAVTCKKFQELEENHLKQMKEFLFTYIELLQNNHDMVGQVHAEFKRQFLEMTVDKLLEQFVLSKYTGLEKPEIMELDLSSWSSSPPPPLPSSSSTTSTIPQTTSANIKLHKSNAYGTNNSPLTVLSESSGFNIVNSDASSSIAVPSIHHQSPSSSATVTTTSSSSPSSAAAASTTFPLHPSPVPPAPVAKKETTYLRNWFNISSASASPASQAAAPSSSSLSSSPINLNVSTNQQSSELSTMRMSPLPHQQQQQQHQQLDQEQQQPIGSIQSTNLLNKKTNHGDYNSDKQNVKTTTVKESTPQQKSSRRTTSLLNLFMSNSQVSAILRSGRNKTKAKKMKNKKKDGTDGTIGSDGNNFITDGLEKDTKQNDSASVTITVQSGGGGGGAGVQSQQQILATSTTASGTVEIDEDGYSVQPKERLWETVAGKKEVFYSDSDSDSDNEEREKKIRVEIKPLNNNAAPISASVDELRATVENLSLSPIGGILSQHQSPAASNSSTPTASQPYAPLQSPTLFGGSNTSKYADLGDIFSEIGEISASAPASATISNSSKISQRQIPTPTSATAAAAAGSSIAIPRPPSRRSEAAARGRISPSTISRADSVGSLEFRTASIGIGSSRGPSPLTIGKSDTIPIAVAFHEIVHAYFKGSDESRCQVKINGDMMLSFPSGVVGVFANNPNPAKLGFRIKNSQNLENIMPNKQLVTIDKLQSTGFSTLIEFNMAALTALLRRQSEQNPTASYFNVDILKYSVRAKSGAASCPFQLVSYWKCESAHTDIKIDYKYNSHAMSAASPLLNVGISVPVDGDVKNVQSKPHSAWLGESNRLVWNFTDISQHSDNNGVGTLRARLEVNAGPSNPSTLNAQFNCEGTTLSGIEFELAGTGYRLSLVKRRFVSGKYICETDGIRTNATTPTPPSANSPSPYLRPSA